MNFKIEFTRKGMPYIIKQSITVDIHYSTVKMGSVCDKYVNRDAALVIKGECGNL